MQELAYLSANASSGDAFVFCSREVRSVWEINVCRFFSSCSAGRNDHMHMLAGSVWWFSGQGMRGM